MRQKNKAGHTSRNNLSPPLKQSRKTDVTETVYDSTLQSERRGDAGEPANWRCSDFFGSSSGLAGSFCDCLPAHHGLAARHSLAGSGVDDNLEKPMRKHCARCGARGCSFNVFFAGNNLNKFYNSKPRCMCAAVATGHWRKRGFTLWQRKELGANAS